MKVYGYTVVGIRMCVQMLLTIFRFLNLTLTVAGFYVLADIFGALMAIKLIRVLSVFKRELDVHVLHVRTCIYTYTYIVHVHCVSTLYYACMRTNLA